MTEQIEKKASIASKWSLVTEVLVKIVSPVTQLVLAHILAPEIFGIVTTVTMVTSFAEMLADAGFQKYIVQHEFSSVKELNEGANVAFLTNFAISIALWGIIALFCSPLSYAIGNQGYEVPLVIACATLPLTALSSIQLAIYHRLFDFKTLLPIRLIAALIPMAIAIPLALLGFSFWSLIFGTLLANAFSAIALTVKSEWKPSLYYSVAVLKQMLSFTIWTLLEEFSIWLTAWVGVFFVGTILNSYDLGLFKMATSTVNAVFAVVANATNSVLIATLSRYQNDKNEFFAFHQKYQRAVAIYLLPMGAMFFAFRCPLVYLFLGSQWADAALLMGLWGITSGLVIVFGNYSSIIYISLGKPKLSMLVQSTYLVFLIPLTIWSAEIGFIELSIVYSLLRIVFIAIHFFVIKVKIHYSPLKMIANVAIPFIMSCILLICSIIWCSAFSDYLIQLLGAVLLVGVYLLATVWFKKSRVAFFESLSLLFGVKVKK